MTEKCKYNKKIQRTAKSVMPFADAKALPLLAAADFGVSGPRRNIRNFVR